MQNKVGRPRAHQSLKRGVRPNGAMFRERLQFCMKRDGIPVTAKDLFNAIPELTNFAIVSEIFSDNPRPGVGRNLSITLARFFNVPRFWLIGVSDKGAPEGYTGTRLPVEPKAVKIKRFKDVEVLQAQISELEGRLTRMETVVRGLTENNTSAQVKTEVQYSV